jgi:hypothetical protein
MPFPALTLVHTYFIPAPSKNVYCVLSILTFLLEYVPL